MFWPNKIIDNYSIKYKDHNLFPARQYILTYCSKWLVLDSQSAPLKLVHFFNQDFRLFHIQLHPQLPNLIPLPIPHKFLLPSLPELQNPVHLLCQ